MAGCQFGVACGIKLVAGFDPASEPDLAASYGVYQQSVPPNHTKLERPTYLKAVSFTPLSELLSMLLQLSSGLQLGTQTLGVDAEALLTFSTWT